jgi:hypothetical protein
MSSTWKQLAGFLKYDGTPTDQDQRPSRIVTSVTPVGTTSRVTQASSNEVSFYDDSADVTGDTSLAEQSVNDDIPVSEGASSAQPVSISAGTSSRGRNRRMSQAMQDSISQRSFYGESGMHYMQAMRAVTSEEAEIMYAQEHDFHLGLQDRMRHPIAFHAEMMGDIMYFHQSMQQPDAGEFVKAVVKEVNGHIESNHWKLIKRDQVPEDVDVLPSVWSMRRKRNLTTNEITKLKARLNLHGGKQVYGMNYFETYAPVVTWFAIRLMLVAAIYLVLALRQVDFVQAYPQAPIEFDMYMELPQGIETRHGNSKDHVLQLLSNIYGQKQAGRVWNGYLIEKLRDIGFEQSLIDECVFYRGDVIFIVYVDDGIFVGADDNELTNVIREI